MRTRHAMASQDQTPSTATVPKHLNFITGNKNKLAEVQAILSGVIELRSQSLDLVEIQGTVEEVTRDKCRRAAEAVQGPVLVEDTCLCFRAMNELPGPYIKWFMQSLGPHQLHKLLAGFDDKSATAVCTFGYSAGPGAEPILFQGRTEGRLVESRGSTVFGWDSCFEYEGKTYAEMEKSEKNAISHRGKALEKLKTWLAQKVDGEAV
ncbi:Ham1-like protein [Westerdykella ornata]|uniref:Inosine triphosphate pyrophosphatase n=1 Tax=Westerdykella ornata TaxID=318751 RepID=A0A6A6J8G7_WESOR|nr:Ham1-like protein [Westerdykella ornata]KAF2272298.1 Ham1-like protein [Westerdykella ornata]